MRRPATVFSVGALFSFLLLLGGCGNTVAPTPTAERPSGEANKTAESRSSNEAPADVAENSGGGRHRHRHKHHASENGPAKASRPAASKKAGAFDFYVMSLSWSPGFCASPAGKGDDQQCGVQRHFGFVLHGLWPQYEQGGWPESCSTEPLDQSMVAMMLPIMPSPKLIGHEWEKHGTCSGLAEKEYFEDATDAFHSVKVPAAYVNLSKQITVNPDDIRKQFGAANPQFGEQGFAVLCTRNGRYLQEIHACLTKDLEGRACNRDVVHEACPADSIIMQPMR